MADTVMTIGGVTLTGIDAGGKWAVRVQGDGADWLLRFRFRTEDDARRAAETLKRDEFGRPRDSFLGLTFSAHPVRRAAAR
jgi:hypothetical protein